MKKFLILILASLFAPIATQSFGLEIREHKDEASARRHLSLSGEIRKGDYLNVRSTLLASSSHMWLVLLDSQGGDVMEAMAIGRLFRSLSLRVAALDCASACFLIWAGGVDRSGGTLRLHRPYFEHEYFANLSKLQADARYRNLSNEVEQYLKEMNIPQDVTQVVFETPSTRSFVVSPSSNQRVFYRLVGRVPAYDEWLNSKCGPFPVDPQQINEVLSGRSQLPHSQQEEVVDKYGTYMGCLERANVAAFQEALPREGQRERPAKR